jgi:uncharacterized protein YjiS (DUF1127 family)
MEIKFSAKFLKILRSQARMRNSYNLKVNSLEKLQRENLKDIGTVS